MATELVTQAEFARRQGVERSAVSKWKAAGLLVMVREGRKDLVDVAASVARIDAERDPTRGRPQGGSPDAAGEQPTELQVVRLDLIREQTTRVRLENARKAGELVARVDAEATLATWARRTRERMQGLSRDLAERLAATGEARQVATILSESIDAAFEDLARDAEAEIADEAAAVAEASDAGDGDDLAEAAEA